MDALLARAIVALAVLLATSAPRNCPCGGAWGLLTAEPTPGIYTLAFSAGGDDPPPQLDPANLTFTLISYDERNEFGQLPYTVLSTGPYSSPGSKRVEGTTFRVQLHFPHLPPNMYTLSAGTTDLSNVTEGQTKLNLYFPDESATHLAALRAGYQGARVWPYGGVSLTCEGAPIAVGSVRVTPTITATGPLRIERLERLTNGTAMIHDDPGNAGFAYEAVAPLLVFVRLPGQPESWSGGGLIVGRIPGGAEGIQRVMAAAMRRCRHVELTVGDRWDLELAVARRPPGFNVAHYQGSLIGLTHEQVAFIRGFPYAYKTRAELLGMAEWDYDWVAPNATYVRFEGDRVVAVPPPVTMP
jgi:hypothetical protein